MHRVTALRFAAVLFTALGFALPTVAIAQDATPAPGAVEAVATGLTNPRGFTWGEDGTLFVALAGNGGLAAGASDAAGPDVEAGTPDLVGEAADLLADDSGAVVRIESGCPEPLAEGLPSYIFVPLNWAQGVIDVAVLAGQLYALVDGGGEAGLHPDEPNGVYRIETDGTATLVADLSAWLRANPVAEPVGEISPDGQPYAMVAGDGVLWIAEANHEQILTVTADGAITRVIDLSPAAVVEIGVPTGIALAPEGGVYVGFLTEVPFLDGTAKVVRVTADGTVTDVWTGLTAVTDITLGPDGTLYATELSTGNTEDEPFYRSNSGRVVRQTGPDGHETVATGLDYPVHLGFGPDGGLYVATPAIGSNAGEGVVLRLDLAESPVALDEEDLASASC